VSKGTDNPRSGPLKRHRGTVRCLIHSQRPLANGESPHRLLIEFYAEQIEDVSPDQEPVFLCRDCMENAIEDLRRTEDVSELWAAFHPRDFQVSDEQSREPSGEYILCQGPRSGIRDHGVSEVRDCRHYLNLVLRGRRLQPDTTLLGEINIPRGYLEGKKPSTQTFAGPEVESYREEFLNISRDAKPRGQPQRRQGSFPTVVFKNLRSLGGRRDQAQSEETRPESGHSSEIDFESRQARLTPEPKAPATALQCSGSPE